MIFIELRGTWREMGRQYGEEHRDDLKRSMEHYAGKLFEDPDRFNAAADAVRQAVAAHAPALLQETIGMAEGAGLEESIALGYRFFPDVRERMKTGCSAIYLAESQDGPLLGRNCDLEREFSPEVQACIVRRPVTGTATITNSYLGVVGAVGLNEHGLGLGGASAHTDEQYGKTGLPGGVLRWKMLQECRNVDEARNLMSKHVFEGKPNNLIAGDASGASVLFEFARGRSPVQCPRKVGLNWQACTNFFVSGEIPIKPQTPYLQSAYARYGRIVHQLGEGLAAHSLTGLKQLLLDIAQPGLCRVDDGGLRTAFTHIMDLAARRVHVTPGHPADTEYKEFVL